MMSDMRLTLLTAMLLALLVAPPALAQSSEDQQARALFDAGRTAYDAGRFEQAMRYFREAYELSHRPALLFNIASAADRLLDIEAALEAYRAYLEAVPNAENRELAQSRITFLEGRLRAQSGGRSEPDQPPPPNADPGSGSASSSSSSSEPSDSRPSGGGDITGEWWFWTLIAVLVVGAGVGIGVGVGVAASGVEQPLPGDTSVTMALRFP